MPRRKKGALLPLEVDILTAGLAMRRGGGGAFHGFELARQMATGGERGLTAHGTLYKALGRLEDWGLLESRWEEAESAAAEGRPRRRLYELTAVGVRAEAAARAGERQPLLRLRPAGEVT